MNKKVITGAVIALAAGVAAFLYRRNRNKVNEAAADAYSVIGDAINRTENKIENAFS